MKWPLLEQLSTDCLDSWRDVGTWVYDATDSPNREARFACEWEKVGREVEGLGAELLPLHRSAEATAEHLIRLLGPIGNRLQLTAQHWPDLTLVQREPELSGLCGAANERETAKRLFGLYGGELFSLIDELVHLLGAHRFQQHFGPALEEKLLSEEALRNEADKTYHKLIELDVGDELLGALTQSEPLVATPTIGVSMAVYSAPTTAPKSPEEKLTAQMNALVQNSKENVGLRLLQRVTGRLIGAPYRVPALFVANGRGAVRDVRITVLPAGTPPGPVVLEFLISAQQTQADKLRDSVNYAREAALQLLRKQLDAAAVPDYAIRVSINGAGVWSFDGDSLGVAVALALMARVRGEQIGYHTVGDVAVTGAIRNAQGKIGEVGGLKDKLEAVLEAAQAKNTPIPRVIAPTANAGEELPASVPIVWVESLEDAISQSGLFDPWQGYLRKLLTHSHERDDAHHADLIATDSQDPLQQLPEVARSWLLCRSEDESLLLARQIASRGAARRLGTRADVTLSEKRRQLIPVIIEAAEWSEDRSLSQVVLGTVRRELALRNRNSSGGLDESVIRTALHDGQILLLLHGLETAPLFFWNRLRRTLEGKPIRLALVSTENAWWHGEQTWTSMGGAPPIKSYQGRATPLDEHAHLMRKVFLEQTREWVPELDTPEEFFERSYWPLHVVPLDHDFKPTGLPLELETVIQNKHNTRILLLGDGGSGKTTALSKLFLAAMRGELMLSPDWPLVPLLFNLGDLQGVTDAHFHRRARALPVAYKNDLSHIGRIPGLLVLLDGLNEVPRAVPRPALVTSLNGLVVRLEGSTDSRFILTCRKQESALPDSLVRRLCRSTSGEAFRPYELLPLDSATSQKIIQAAPQGQKVLDKMGESAAKLLCNPLVLRLACIASGRLAASQTPITRDTIFSYAVRRMLERDTEEQNVLSGALTSLGLAHQGMAILAALMVERGGLVEIEAKEAATLLLECVAKERWDAHLWWARVGIANAGRISGWSADMSPSQQRAWMEIIVEEFSKTSLMRAVF